VLLRLGATAVGGAVCFPGKLEGFLVALKHYTREMSVSRADIPDTILPCGFASGQSHRYAWPSRVKMPFCSFALPLCCLLAI
jgi:hypothetical protein